MPFFLTGREEAELETVLAVMSFPRDEDQRHWFLARFKELMLAEVEKAVKDEPDYQALPLAQILGEAYGSFLEPLGGFSVLSGAPGFSEIKTRSMERVWPGQIAGEILLNLVQLQVAGPGASVNKAVALAEAYLAEGVKARSGDAGGRSVRYIRQAWEDFKPACHLWAAFRWWADGPQLGSPFQENALPLFLARSQQFLGLASRLRSASRKEMLLDVAEMWQVSRRHPLPTLKRLHIPPLAEWQLEVLRRHYKSRRL